MTQPTNVPVVFIQNDQVYANSQDVAKFFEKKHFNVLRDIDHLIEQWTQEGIINFEDTRYVHPQNGQTYRTYNMTKDGFALLVMGFTGKKALAFKLQYIEAFNRMEEQIRRQADMIVLPDFTKPAAGYPSMLMREYSRCTDSISNVMKGL